MWREVPLKYVILERIRKLGKPIKDTDLYQEIKESVRYEFSYGEFLKAIMSLEMSGFISVTLIKEGQRMITYLGEKE
ncbi:MAG: hypothetical protein QXV69_02610 [Sulfolobaceae archaeon]